MCLEWMHTILRTSLAEQAPQSTTAVAAGLGLPINALGGESLVANLCGLHAVAGSDTAASHAPLEGAMAPLASRSTSVDSTSGALSPSDSSHLFSLQHGHLFSLQHGAPWPWPGSLQPRLPWLC